MSLYSDKKQTIRGLQLMVGIAELDCKLNAIMDKLKITESDYPEVFKGIRTCEEQLAELSKKEKELYEAEEKATKASAEELLNAVFGLGNSGENSHDNSL